MKMKHGKVICVLCGKPAPAKYFKEGEDWKATLKYCVEYNNQFAFYKAIMALCEKCHVRNDLEEKISEIGSRQAAIRLARMSPFDHNIDLLQAGLQGLQECKKEKEAKK